MEFVLNIWLLSPLGEFLRQNVDLILQGSLSSWIRNPFLGKEEFFFVLFSLNRD
jgi:hypothetical protein